MANPLTVRGPASRRSCGTAAGGKARTGGSRRREANRRRLTGFLFVLPTVVFFLGFIAYPFLRSLYVSMTSWSGYGQPRFIGLANFRFLFEDPVFFQALRTTLVFTVVATVLQTVIPLLLAALVNVGWRGGTLFRTVIFLPQVVSLMVSGLVWQLMYDPNFGTVNRILDSVGLGGLARSWLGDPNTALWALLVVSLWQAVGFYLVMYYAGLQSIDRHLYEAARVDGANRWQEFTRITVPLLRPITAVVITLNLINGLKVFDLVYVMTGGGPNHATEVLGTYTYSLALGSSAGAVPALGYATSVSVIIFVLCALTVLLQSRVTRGADRDQ